MTIVMTIVVMTIVAMAVVVVTVVMVVVLPDHSVQIDGKRYADVQSLAPKVHEIQSRKPMPGFSVRRICLFNIRPRARR